MLIIIFEVGKLFKKCMTYTVSRLKTGHRTTLKLSNKNQFFKLIFMQESNIVYLMSKASVAVSNCSRIWKIPGSSRLGGSAFTMLSSNLADEKRKNGG